MTHSQDDIVVYGLRLSFITGKNGWLMPWGEVVSNPLNIDVTAPKHLRC
ncbi:DUF1317 domain-containing protein [Scandinavium sp. H11S7]|uniref:DUF1317 domain-containing protein n=1 Tax=Scandinavium hiltneri TaxID=2926519 RepID=A0ABT2E2P5_9ENTR|nr:DUF1317 domain-containing protein [Scandinavium hiltneri]MCS2161698.1 DUF1317 domain-containing protein [Scandinavium hiltneri]